MKILLVARMRFGRRMMRMMSTSSMPMPNPWLMLPPTFDRRRGGMVYNFYSPAEQEVLLINKYGPGRDPPEFPDDNAKVVGSSHGWLALMNQRNNELFLSNPITRRHIKLPPIQSLPNPEINLEPGTGRALVSKLILSTPPDHQSCRAMVSFGPYNRLAYCRPGHSHEWVPFGNLFMLGYDDLYYPKDYDDFVFSSKSNLCTCLTSSVFDDWGLEDWDLTNLDSPKLACIQRGAEPSPSDDDHDTIITYNHLVYEEDTDTDTDTDKLLLLRRSINRGNDKTVSFTAHSLRRHENGCMDPTCSLRDHTIFVGTNHSFAISHFNPNTIYFTHHKDHDQEAPPDVGIYDCAARTVSDCYYPLHHTAKVTFRIRKEYQGQPDIADCLFANIANYITNIDTAPIWFNPTLT